MPELDKKELTERDICTKRIVARVEEMLRWCDTLEAQLHQTRTLGAHLLASTLHHLIAA